MIFDENNNQKKAGVSILITGGKIDFKSKIVKRDKQGHHILIKVNSLRCNIKKDTPDKRVPQNMKQILTELKKRNT